MKLFLLAFALATVIACNDDNTESTKHPNDVTNGAVISTDTAAIAGDSSNLPKDTMRPKR